MTNLAPITLQQDNISLRPMQELDGPALYHLAQENLGQLIYMLGPQYAEWYENALIEFQRGLSIPLTILVDDEIAGTIRYGDINATLPAIEIGWAWLDQKLHGSGIYQKVNVMMMRHAFETWRCIRVQFKTASSNIRAQKAIEKLGAVKEGQLRNHRRIANGEVNDTIIYSITDQDWQGMQK